MIRSVLEYGCVIFGELSVVTANWNWSKFNMQRAGLSVVRSRIPVARKLGMNMANWLRGANMYSFV
jgi:hypothetical protein